MSDEVIAGEVEPEVTQPESAEQAEVTEQVETSEPKPNRTEKRISRLVANIHHKDQKLAQAEAEIATLRAVKEKTPDPTPVAEFPTEDLRYDSPDEYESKLRAYNTRIAREEFAKIQTQQAQDQERQQATAQQAKQEEQNRSIVESYIDNGLESGISEDKLAANEQILRGSNIKEDIARRLYSDANGAQMVDFLCANPDKLDALVSMNPYDAAVHIAVELKPQALSVKPTQTNAPEPLGFTQGGGAPPKDEWDSLAGGATFE